MSEEEILNIMNKLGNIYDELKKDDEEGHSSAYEMQFEDFEAIQGLLDLYNKEKEQNRVNIDSINNLMKECNEENKRCMELAIELDREKEKNKELIEGQTKTLGKLLIPELLKNYISKDKIKEIIYPTPTNPISYEIQTSDMYKKILELLGEE